MSPTIFNACARTDCWILTALLLALLSAESWAEKIRTAIPQANLNYLSIYVAEARGFFRDEGLENETVVISGPLATAALLSGDVDFSGGGGSGCARLSMALRSRAFTFKQRK
jgi:ABC-type nitrate/sulfonate/bicarbonate transport system substrate-binding protein